MVTCLLLRITCRFPSLDYLAIALPLGQVCYAWVPGVLGRCELRSRQRFPLRRGGHPGREHPAARRRRPRYHSPIPSPAFAHPVPCTSSSRRGTAPFSPPRRRPSGGLHPLPSYLRCTCLSSGTGVPPPPVHRHLRKGQPNLVSPRRVY